MSDNKTYLQGQTYSLSGSGISSSATSIGLVSFTYPNGTAIVTADLGSAAYATIEPGTTREENISFTGVTQNGDGTATLTGVTRGLKFKPDYSADATLQVPHAGGVTLRLTNSAPFYSNFANKDNDETVAQTWTFTDPNIPKMSSTTVVPTNNAQFATKYYVDQVAGGGTVSYDSVIVAGTAGETVASGNLVYLKASDGRWWLADADAASTSENVQLGIAQGAGTAGNGITNGVLIQGLAENLTGLTANTKYYVSNTAGAISTTPGTKEVTVGESQSTTVLLFVPRNDQQITEDQQDALAGSYGTPSSTNVYVTNDDTTSGIDQQQTTRDASSAVGAADTTGNRNKLAQSFTAGKTYSLGVELNKQADTGSFTGTVTVSLQADNAGSPSGTPLATVTMSNAAWLLQAAGPVTFIWGTAYTSLTVGSLYWYVIETSTADSSNRPNIGTNSAGGYADGSAKYNNTTDGWVAIATIDLYFRGLTATTSRVLRVPSDGNLVAQPPFGADTGSSDAYEINIITNDTTYVTGRMYNFSATTANTGAATLNVNSWGAKTIKKQNDQDLATGDIEAGQIITVVYDGTNMQMQSQLASESLVFKNGTTSYDMSTASGNQTIAHGLGKTPKFITLQVLKGSSIAATFESFGVYNGTTNSCVFNSNNGTDAFSNDTNIAYIELTAGNKQVATATVDATNITLAWTKTGTPTGSMYILWTAQA